jgi:hypothetical protein
MRGKAMMKQTIGVFTLIAAVVLIACSATTLFHTAFDSAVGTWQQWTQGSQIVAVIIWEAGAVIAITYCFRHGHAFIALAGSVLLVLAMGYTLSQELRQQAGAQESSAIARGAKKGKLELVRGELDNAIKMRDDLQRRPRLTDDQRAVLADARARIARLTDKWEAQLDDAPAATAPGVALIARWTGLNINDSADLDPLIKMAFWTMARVFALPLTVFGISLLGAATLPSQPLKSEEPQASGLTVQRAPREPMKALERISGVTAVNYSGFPISSPEVIADARNNPKPEEHSSVLSVKAEDTPPTADVTTFFDPDPESGTRAPAPDTTVVTGPWEPKQKRNVPPDNKKNAPRGCVATWKGERLEKDAGGGISTNDLWLDYRNWSEAKGHSFYNDSHFGRQLNKLGMIREGKVIGGWRPGWRLKAEVIAKRKTA